jgi:hypothetical protein
MIVKQDKTGIHRGCKAINFYKKNKPDMNH